jgi:VCBS repeat-containing protein
MNANLIKTTIALACVTSLTACNFSNDDSPTPNSSPMAMDANLIAQTDTPIMDTLSATDADDDALTFSVKTEPASGTLMIMSNGSFTYTPAANFVGSDSFMFTVTDGMSAGDEGTINITIETLQLSFADYSRQAFAQSSSDTPLPLNGRAFMQDVTDADAYDDLLNSN